MKRTLSAVALLCAACTFDPSDVDTTKPITCGTASDCPPTFQCALAVGVCVSVNESDRSPPKLEGPSLVVPSLVRVNDTLKIGLRVNEPLVGKPDILLQFADGTLSAPLTVDDVGDDGREFTASRKALATDPEGPVRVLADFLDTKGNQAGRVDIGGARFDFTSPSIVPGSESLRLTAGPASGLSTVTALSSTSSATLGFTVSETLRGPPQISATAADGGTISGLQFVYTLGASVTFAWTISAGDGGVAQGPVTLVATLEDLAGNTTRTPITLPAPGLTIDTLAPAALTSGDGGIVLERTPWGSAELEVGASWLRARAGVAEPGGTVIVSEREASREFGRVQAGADGAFAIKVPTELTEAYLTAVDHAGNRSPMARVERGLLVVSMGGSAVGNTAANPNEYESRDVHGPAWLQADAVARFSTSGMARPGGSALSTPGAWSWQRRTNRAPPAALAIPLVWDEEEAHALALGGIQAGVPVTGSVLSWAGADWASPRVLDSEGDGNPVSQPGAGFARTAAYDPLHRETLLLVQALGGTETWAWNGVSWARRLKTAAGPVCDSCQVVFSDTLGRPLLADHTSASRVLLYAWNAPAAHWDALDGGSTAPAPRQGAAVAWDPLRQNLVMLGGLADGGLLGDVWTWSVANGWSQPQVSTPNPAYSRATTWDPDVNAVVFAGGFATGIDGGLSGIDDVWEWNGATFTRSTRTNAGADLPLGGASLVWDRTRQQRVLIGGASELTAAPNSGTWAWKKGLGWKLLSRPGSPSARSGHAAIWDSAAKRTLVYGGRTSDTFVNAYRDLWTWNGTQWSWVDALPTGGGPDARFRAALAQRDSTGDIVMSGGVGTSLACLSDAWVLRNDRWSQLPNEQARCGHVAFGFAVRDTVVVAGGSPAVSDGAGAAEAPAGFNNSIREWQLDAGWRGVSTTSTFMYGAAFAANTQHTELIAHGGFNSTPSQVQSDTWSYTGSSWTRVNLTAGSPRPQVAHAAMARNDRVGAWLMYGGVTPSESSILWSFDGGTWSRPVVADPEGDGDPGPRSRASLTHDTTRDVDVLFGGLSSGSVLDDMWELHTDGRPSHVFRVKLSSLGSTTPVVQAIDVRGIAGATAAALTTGIEVGIWLRGTWAPLCTTTGANGQPHADSSATPGAFTCRITSRNVIDALMQREELGIALLPRGTNGALPAVLTVDHVEARLEYQLN